MSLSCQVCHEQFESREALREHINFFESQERSLDEEYARSRRHALDNCEKTYVHGALHVCERCDQPFETNCDLERHIEKFRSLDLLLLSRLTRTRLHIPALKIAYGRTSSKECPWENCNQTCNDASNLKRHFQAHVECFEICPECLESFRFCDTLLRHHCVETSTRLQHRKKISRQKASDEYKRAINLCSTVPAMSTKRLRINDLDSHAKRARPRLNASRISTNSYDHSGPAATEDMPPMTMHDDTRSIILADETTPAHQYHDSTDIGGFFAAVNSSNTAEFFDDTIGQFYITESNNVARLIAATDDDDSGMFFASIPTGDFSAPQMPHKPLEQ